MNRGISRAAIALAVAGAGAWAALTFVSRAGRDPADVAVLPEIPADARTKFEQFLDTEPRVPVPVDAGTATVVIVKFNDWQCPPCRQTYRSYKPILEKWERERPGAVKFVLKDYPLDADCNVNVPSGTGHLSACEAAVAVRLARRHGRDVALEEWLFDHQEELSPALVKEAARDVGQVTDFDVEYPKVIEEVKADIALARKLGVAKTPTFFINGLKTEGGFQPQYFDAAIAHELARAKTTPK